MSTIMNYFSSSSSHDRSSKKVYQSQLPKRNHVPTGFKTQNLNQNGPRYFHVSTIKMGLCSAKTVKMPGSSIHFPLGATHSWKITSQFQKHIKTADHKRALQTKIMKPDFDQGVANANLYWMAKHNQPNSLYTKVNDLLVHVHHVRGDMHFQ